MSIVAKCVAILHIIMVDERCQSPRRRTISAIDAATDVGSRLDHAIEWCSQ